MGLGIFYRTRQHSMYWQMSFQSTLLDSIGFHNICSKTVLQQDVFTAQLSWMLAERFRYMGWKLGYVLVTHHLLCRCKLDNRPADGRPVVPFQNSLFP